MKEITPLQEMKPFQEMSYMELKNYVLNHNDEKASEIYVVKFCTPVPLWLSVLVRNGSRKKGRRNIPAILPDETRGDLIELGLLD